MIYLYGASGHAKVIIEVLEQNGYIIGGLIDINPNIKNLFNYPVYITTAELPNSEFEVLISIGNNRIRKHLARTLNGNYTKAISSTANISPRAIVGKGSVVMAGVSINSSAIIGEHVILNTNCCVDHDCMISDFVHISPNAALAGNVTVEEGVHIGIGACIIQGIKIGKWATIGAGAVIINDVPDYAVVVGNPGKIIKYNQP